MTTTSGAAAKASRKLPSPTTAFAAFDKLPDSAQLRVQDVAALMNYSVASVWRRAQVDPTFPQPRRVGPKATRWTAGDVRRHLGLGGAK